VSFVADVPAVETRDAALELLSIAVGSGSS
jgi:hypothetical protein